MIKRTRLSVFISRYLNKMTTSSFWRNRCERGHLYKKSLATATQKFFSEIFSRSVLKVNTSVRWDKIPRKMQRGTDEHRAGTDSGSLQWLEKEIHGSPFLMYLTFRECTWSGIFRSMYFHVLIFDAWSVTVWYLRKLEADIMKNWDLIFSLYLGVLYHWCTNCQRVLWGSESQVLVKHLEYVKCNLKAEILAGLGPSSFTELALQHWLMLVLHHLNSDRAFQGGNSLTMSSLPSPWFSKSACSAAGHCISWSYN